MMKNVSRRNVILTVLPIAFMAIGVSASANGGDMAQAVKRITEVDKLTVWVLTDNYYDALRQDNEIAKRTCGPVQAEHGISYLVETVVKGKTTICMFDYGYVPSGLINNIDVLGLDIGKVSAFALSHGHHDHYSGLLSILKKYHARISKGASFYVGEEAFAQRYYLHSEKPQNIEDMGQLKKHDIESYGLKTVEVNKLVEIVPGAYLTGNIDRVTAYETINPKLLIKRGEKLEVDNVSGEQALFFNVKGKGLVILSGCAHAGIVNTVKHVRKIAGTDKIHAVIGGFHLINAKPETIQNTVTDIKSMKPDYVIPAHCTGFEAIAAFSRELPSEFILNTAGTKYNFSAQEK